MSVLEGYLGYFLLGAWLERLERPIPAGAADGCSGQLGGDCPGYLDYLSGNRYLRRAVCCLPGHLYHGPIRLLFLLFKDLFRGEKAAGGGAAVGQFFGVYLAHP